MPDITVMPIFRTVKVLTEGKTITVSGGGRAVIVREQGPQGIPGITSTPYNHVQSSALATWTVAHNLGRYPAGISIWNIGGLRLGDAQVLNLSTNTLQLTFDFPLAGSATIF